eukprot:5786857-Pyramimonas_sp.AAC.1
MARSSPELLARIMIEIVVLPDLEGERKACKCGTMGLHLRECQSDKEVGIAGFRIPQMDYP